MSHVRSIKDAKHLKGKRVLIRVDYNVPVENGKVLNDYRIQKSIATINYVRNQGGTVILMSHFEDDKNESFDIVAKYIEAMMPIDYCSSFDKETLDRTIAETKLGVVLLPNLRNHPGEKTNDPEFAEFLASLGDVYVNEAFSVSHRKHASIVGVPKYLDSYIGLAFEIEVRSLARAFDPGAKSLFILGGAKFDTKMPLLSKFANVYTNIFIGGTLANTVLKSQGVAIGKSAFDEGEINLPEKEKGAFVLPVDVIVEDSKGQKHTRDIGDVGEEEMIFDAGPKSEQLLVDLITQSDFVLWNGTLGYYEKGYDEGTLFLAKAIAESEAHSILGGGDTVGAIESLGLYEAYDHVSTGGGAMLDFLANETLPGLEVLK